MRHGLKSRYFSFLHWLRALILDAADIDEAILLASFYGEVKHYNFDGIYFDALVEQKVRNLYLAARPGPRLSSPGPDVVLLASDLLDYGGHTRVALRWLEWKPDGRAHRLIVTRSLTEKVRAMVSEAGEDLFVCENYSAAAIDDILRLASHAAIIVLHIHPDDIVAAVAARILQDAGRTVIFYNHADHCFSFGIHETKIVAEIGHFGEDISRRSGRVSGSSCWLGIPAEADPRASDHDDAKGDRIVLACGSSSKFRPSGTRDFGDFIDALLRADLETKVVLVGPTGREPWWTKTRARWGARVEFTGFVPHSRFVAELRNASVFVDGFPMGGGTAFVEAVLAGKLCTGLFLPMSGYSHSDALRVTEIPALVNRVRLLLDRDATQVQAVHAVREQVAQSVGRDAFVNRVVRLYRGDVTSSFTPFDRSPVGNSRWYEQKWEAAGRLNIPTGGTFRKLPYCFRLRLLWRLAPAVRHLSPATAIAIFLAGMKRKALRAFHFPKFTV